MKFSVNAVGLTFKIIDGDLCLLALRPKKEGQEWRLPSVNLSNPLQPEKAITNRINELRTQVTYAEQLYTFVEPQDGIVEMAYILLAEPSSAADSISDAVEWVSAKRSLNWYASHCQVREIGIQRLRNKISYSRIATRLLAPDFTLTELMNVYEKILGEKIDKRNFRKKVESKKIAVPTSKYKHGVHRPARLYKRGPKSKNLLL